MLMSPDLTFQPQYRARRRRRLPWPLQTLRLLQILGFYLRPLLRLCLAPRSEQHDSLQITSFFIHSHSCYSVVVGAAVGGALAGLAVIGVIALVVTLLYCRQRKRQRRPLLASDTHTEPDRVSFPTYNPGPPSSTLTPSTRASMAYSPYSTSVPMPIMPNLPQL